jgi:hypothetical protein
MLQQADEEQLDALDGRRKIKGLCETRWSSRADALNIFKSASSCLIFRRLEITVSALDAASTKSIEGLCKRLDNAKLY